LFIIAILFTFGVGVAFWPGRYPLTEKTLFIIGIGLASVGAAGRAWATSYISGRKLRHLVRTGPYSLCRNPLYLFSVILGIGFGFCTETFTMPILIAAVLMVLYYFQIRSEERRLLKVFGPQYQAYQTEVPRFFPSWRQFSEPDEITISPRLLKKGLFGIAFMLILIGLLELLEGLHQLGVLPALFRIY
jgi:protein-S-isoprenylcysteine O-methyltransferase Ste14